MTVQPHPELNFRRGKGMSWERVQGQTPHAIIRLCRRLGMTDDEMRAMFARWRNEAQTTRGKEATDG